MKELLKQERIYLTDKQVTNLSRIIPKEFIPKYAPLIKVIGKIPNIEATFVVDEMTWHIICSEAARRRIPAKELIKEFTCKEVCRLDKDYKAIYPLIKALTI
ncbi:MAG: hypothetical protein KAU20_05835 [Nanoarchaeota archaeon]|nr:hypothetical protein [Nanoarchaeota archaeon]